LKLASGTVCIAVGAVLSQALSAAGSIATARVLNAAGFGQLGFVRSTLIMFGVLAGSGLGLVATRHVARTRRTDPARAGGVVVLLQSIAAVSGIAMAVLVWAASPLIAEQYAGDPSLADSIRLGSVLLALNAYNGVQLGAIAGCEAFGWVALLGAADGLLTVSLIPAGALVAGVHGAVAATVIVASIGSWLKHSVLHRVMAAYGIVLRWRRGIDASSEIWRGVVPAILLGVAVQPFEWTTRVSLTREGGFGEMGIFTAAYTWGQFVAFLPAQVSGPALPMLAAVYAEGRVIPFLRLLTFSGMGAAGIGVLVALLGISASNYIVAVYGPEFETAGPVLIALFVAYALCSASTFLRSVLVATGRLWSQAFSAVLWGGTLVGWFYWSPSQSALSLAQSYVVAFGVTVLTQSLFLAWALKAMTSSGWRCGPPSCRSNDKNCASSVRIEAVGPILSTIDESPIRTSWP
jgi:O-antigen/teichoic acid export membrane protein